MFVNSSLWEISYLDQLHDFSFLSSNSFLHPFSNENFGKKFLEPKIISFSETDFYESTYTYNNTSFNQEINSKDELIFTCDLDSRLEKNRES